MMDDQIVVDVRIYQGENEDALENIKIGQFMVEGLRKAQVGNPLLLNWRSIVMVYCMSRHGRRTPAWNGVSASIRRWHVTVRRNSGGRETASERCSDENNTTPPAWRGRPGGRSYGSGCAARRRPAPSSIRSAKRIASR